MSAGFKKRQIDIIVQAALLLSNEAYYLRESHTVNGAWALSESEAKESYQEMMKVSRGLRRLVMDRRKRKGIS